MNVSIINIGDELLIGQVVNTNASTISKMLVSAGMDVKETAVIADDRDAILSSLSRCLAKTDAVLITGGLGPTKDDITKKVLCEFFDSHLVENEEALNNVKRIFEARGYELTPINRQQAWVPECCTMVNNILGTAPCMWFEQNGKVVVSMPGVPFEMENLMRTEIVPRLQKHFHTGHIINKNLLIQGIGESFLSDLIESWELALPKTIRLAYLPQAGMVKLRLTARGDDRDLLQKQIADAVNSALEQKTTVHKTLTANGRTLATAESCTGGAIASRLTALSGASVYFRGGIVAYSNEVKECALGVQHTVLEQHGAVSEETVRQMAEGARRHLGADYAIATSGIAGPTGGTPDKPVGTVWIAVSGPIGTETRLKKFGDDRLRTIDRTCNEAFAMLINILNRK